MYGPILADMVSSAFSEQRPPASLEFPLFSEDSDAGPVTHANMLVMRALMAAADGDGLESLADSTASVLATLDPQMQAEVRTVPLASCTAAVGWVIGDDDKIAGCVDALADGLDVGPRGGEDRKMGTAVAATVRSCRKGDSRFLVKRMLSEDHGVGVPVAVGTAADATGGSAGNCSTGDSVALGVSAFARSWGFEHALRLAVVEGGGVDRTRAVVAAAAAEATFTVPAELRRAVCRMLDPLEQQVLETWEARLWEVSRTLAISS